MPSCSPALVLKLVVQIAKLPTVDSKTVCMGWEFQGDSAISHNGCSLNGAPSTPTHTILVSKEDTDALRLLVFVYLVLCMTCRQYIAP